VRIDSTRGTVLSGRMRCAPAVIQVGPQKERGEKFQYRHPSVDYGFKRWYQDQGRTFEQQENEAAKWEKLAKEITQR